MLPLCNAACRISTRTRNRSQLRAAAALFCLLGVVATKVHAGQTPRELVAKGDRSWSDKSYTDAADAYSKALEADPKLPERPEMKLRILITDIRASKWDKALAESDAYQHEYRGSVYEGLGMQWRARLYATVEHNGFRVGKRVFRGPDAPETRGKEEAVSVELEASDAAEAARCFEMCRVLLDKSRKAALPVELRTRAAAVEIENDFDILSRVRQDDDSSRFRLDRTDWTIDLHLPFDSRWPTARQVMYLYKEIIEIDAEAPGSNHHSTVLANLGAAAYIVTLRSRAVEVYPNLDARIHNRTIRLYIPYAAQDPVALLDETVRKYPADPEADRLAFLAALWREQAKDCGHAAAAYRALLAAYPNGRWSSDARKNLDGLTRPSLAVSAPPNTRPGTRLILSITMRNISLVKFAAYRVHPETRFGHTSYTEEYLRIPGFTDIKHHFLVPEERARYRKEKIAEWTATTTNNGLLNLADDTVETPLDSLGAYIIEARDGDHNDVGVDTLAIVTDIAIVQKVDRDSVLCYTADSKTGKPVPGVKLTLWEPRRAAIGLDRDALYATGVTDSVGAFRAPLPDQLNPVPDGYETDRTAETFAWAGGNRYAIAAAANYSSNELPVGESSYRGYITTDRPLYRPGQTINYRLVLTKGSPQRYTLAANKEALLTLEGPRGEVIHKTVITNATGAVNDSFSLPAGTVLGAYRLSARPLASLKLPDGQVYAMHEFRVEEYKKPEYSVSVTPEKSEVRVGEKLSVTISAAYFFGAPVTNAKIHYKVYRKPSVHPSPFKSRIEWFPQSDDGRSPNGFNRNIRRSEQNFDTSYWGAPESVYREGGLVSNARGEAKLTFPTDPPKPPKGYSTNPGLDTDQGFTIEAVVTDSSRREVSGTGFAVAGARRFHAAMRLDRSFVLPGDAMQVEVNTRDSNDRPFAAEGYVSFWKQIPEIPERKEKDPETGKLRVVQPFVPAREEKDGSLLVKTYVESGGTGTAYWRPTAPGDYVLVYEAQDGWGHSVVSRQSALVYGRDFDERLTKDDGRWGIAAEHEMYEQGENARLLIVTPAPNCYVLLTDQSQGAIRHYRTVFVPGRSTIAEIPLGSEHFPNALFSASLVINGEVMETSVGVDVAAIHQTLSLAITMDKREYKPGERAQFRVHAVDSRGKPAVGEVSLGVVDEALLAMQPDETPDIRTSFYGFRITATAASASSGDYQAEQHLLGPSVPNLESHPLTFPEGSNWLADRAGSSSEELPSYLALEVNPPDAAPKYIYEEVLPVRMAGDATELPLTNRAARAANFHAIAGLLGNGSGNINASNIGGGGESQGARSGILDTDRRLAHGSNSDLFKPFGLIRDESTMALPPSFRNSDAVAGEGPLAAATVRKSFSDTAYWMPSVTTDASGNASVEFNFPDNITKWHVTARGITSDVKVGTVETQTTTTKNLLVRLQAPRFFVERDEVTLSANVHNYLASARQARIELVLDPAVFAGADPAGSGSTLVRTVPVEKDGEARIDWTMKLLKPGVTKIKVVAQTDEESDAAELAFPVLVHGVEKFVANSGVLKDGAETSLTLNIPEERRKGASLLDVQMSPSIASVVLDALPYLEDYPYGCVEQTLSRFVPTVTTAKALRDAGIDLEALGKRAAALEEQRRSIPAQQQVDNSGYTYPKGVPGVLDANALAARMLLNGRSHAPVFDTNQLQAMTTAGLSALYDQQRDDGSWGWWKGSTAGDAFLSAYAVEGLLKAQQAGVSVKAETLTKAIACLDAHLDTTQELNRLAYFSYVLSQSASGPPDVASARHKMAEDTLYTRRDRLSPYGQALLALTLHNYKAHEKAAVLLRNLVTTARQDAEHGTVHWESADKEYWNWYNDKQETTAAVLQAMVAISPAEQLAPANGAQSAETGLAPMAVRWLVDSRRGGHWDSTRQTANVAEALLAYAKATRELNPNYTVTVDVDGKVKKSFHINGSNALIFDNRFLVGDEILASGGQKLNIHMSGSGTLYWNSYLNYFDMSEPIKGQANAISVERKYFRLIPKSAGSRKRKDSPGLAAAADRSGEADSQQDDEGFVRVPLQDGASLTSGDIVQVELYLKSDNDYAYVVFEDMKPAGCEAVETRSGEAYGDGLCSNFELRDEKLAFFMDTLPQGTRRITYKLRAEVPGVFHALPTNGYAMYTPDIRATSDEWRVRILDAPAAKLPTPRNRK